MKIPSCSGTKILKVAQYYMPYFATTIAASQCLLRLKMERGKYLYVYLFYTMNIAEVFCYFSRLGSQPQIRCPRTCETQQL